MITTPYTPKPLCDNKRLQEIYKLRVDCWENSNEKQFINRTYFPNGWFDEYDETAYHWIVEDNNMIIASARVCILEEIPNDFKSLLLTDKRPIAYFSRLVIHPRYRGRGITLLLDKIRIEFLRSFKIPFAIIAVNIERINSLKKQGFVEVGSIIH